VLRTNLSTRPFYNERIVHAVAAVVAVLVLAVTGWQIARVVRLSRYKTELNSAIKRDREQVDLLTREAADIRRGLDQKQLTLVATQAREANTLIEMRTFSWTQLFNQLEATLPNDVMLTSVRPEFADSGVTRVNMEIQGKDEEVIDTFWQQLEKTGAFHDIEWSGVNISDVGMHKVQMTAVYTGSAR
jgi:Tfp pilus assembly protein PilN